MRWGSVFCLAISLAVGTQVCAVAATDNSEVFLYEDGVGGEMWYRLYLPDNYDPLVEYPLTLIMQGSGAVGPVSDPSDVNRGNEGAVAALRTDEFASILVAPHIESGSWRTPPNDELMMGVLESLQDSYLIDERRRYVTGESLGGFGTWHMIARFPGYFAAAVPVAGGGVPFTAELFADTPVWAFHGSFDTVVPPQLSRDMIVAQRSVGGAPLYTELPNGGHEVWGEVYDANPGTLPRSVTFTLNADTSAKTFELLATASDNSVGLHSYSVSLEGVDTITHLSPKSDFTPSEDTSLGFTERRSVEELVKQMRPLFPVPVGDEDPDDPFGDCIPVGNGFCLPTEPIPVDVTRVSARQARVGQPGVVVGFGKEAGSLPGAGTGEGEIQPQYDVPLLLASGTYEDLDELDFSYLDVFGGTANALFGEFLLSRTANVYVRLAHDGEVVYESGRQMGLYPWLLDQSLPIPEPSSVVLAMVGLLAAAGCRRYRFS